LSNTEGNTSVIREAVVLVLLMRGIYDVRHGVVRRWRGIYILSLMKICTDIQTVLRFRLKEIDSIGIAGGGDLRFMPWRWLHMA
jgi:hypothetical protein